MVVDLRYSEDAQIWYVHAATVPGLHAEAATIRELMLVLADVMPDLIEANGSHAAD